MLKITPCKTCAGAVNTMFVDHAALVTPHPGTSGDGRLLIVASPPPERGGAPIPEVPNGGAAASRIGVVDVSGSPDSGRDVVTGLVFTSAGSGGGGGALPLGGVTEEVTGLTARAVAGGGLSAEVYFTTTGDSQPHHCVRKLTLSADGTATGSGSQVAAGSCDVADAVDHADSLAARFNAPTGLAMSPDGTHLYIADTENHAVRRVTLQTGEVTTVAGHAGQVGDADGIKSNARLRFPTSVAVGTKGSGAALFVAEKAKGRVRWVDISADTADVVTLVGGGEMYTPGQHADGDSTTAKLRAPSALAARGELVYVADEGSVRVIDVGAGVPGSAAGAALRTVAGADTSAVSDVLDGIGANARFSNLAGACVSFDGMWVFVADEGESVSPFVQGGGWSHIPSTRPRLRRVAVAAAVLRPPALPTLVLRKTETLTLSLSSSPGAGNGVVVVTPKSEPQPDSATFEPPTMTFGENDVSKTFTVTANALGSVSVRYELSGAGAAARAVAVHEGGNLDAAAVTKSTVAMPAALSSSFTAEEDTVVTVELSSPPGSQLNVRFHATPGDKVTFTPQLLTFYPGQTRKDVTVTPNAVGDVQVQMSLHGHSVNDFEGPGQTVANLTVVPPQTVGATSTLAGPSASSGGGGGGGGSSVDDAVAGAGVRFSSSGATALSSDGSTLFVVDVDNITAVTRVRVVNTTTCATSTAFTDTSVRNAPPELSGQIYGLALSTDGDTLYLSDYARHTIRAMTGAADVASPGGALTLQPGAVVAGVNEVAGFVEGNKGVGKMDGPMGIAVASLGGADVIFVADSHNRAIRVVTASMGVIATIAGNGPEASHVYAHHGPDEHNNPKPARDARYVRPVAVAVTPDASKAYVVDAGFNQVAGTATHFLSPPL